MGRGGDALLGISHPIFEPRAGDRRLPRAFGDAPAARVDSADHLNAGARFARLSHQHLLGVLLDEMSVARVEPLMLPLPMDSRAMAVAQHVLRSPCSGEPLDLLSRRYGASRRTLERLFRNETGMSFGLWRQKVRMLDSVRLLSEGKSVTDAAFDTGYASLSAFIAAFKNTFGCTPGRLE